MLLKNHYVADTCEPSGKCKHGTCKPSFVYKHDTQTRFRKLPASTLFRGSSLGCLVPLHLDPPDSLRRVFPVRVRKLAPVLFHNLSSDQGTNADRPLPHGKIQVLPVEVAGLAGVPHQERAPRKAQLLPLASDSQTQSAATKMRGPRASKLKVSAGLARALQADSSER